MKKILILVFLVCVKLVSVGWARPLKIVTTTEDLAAIAKELVKDRGEVISLTKGINDPHYIEVRPSDMIKVSRADLFVMVGLDLELWAFPVLEGARNPKVQLGGPGFVDCSAGLAPLELPTGRVDRSQGDVHPKGNPHYWLDPGNGKIIAKNILEGLIRGSPSDAQFFQENFQDFSRRLDQAIVSWKKSAEPLKGMETITYHKTWSYFAAEFGIKVVDYIEPRAGVPPPPRHIQDVITRIRQDKIPVLIVDPYFDIRLPQKIEKETQARLVVLAPSVGAAKEVKTYFQLFDYNLKLLLDALSRRAQ